MIGSRSKDKEMAKIQDRLRHGEEILLVTTQAKAVKPDTYFITNERVLIRQPRKIAGDVITSLQWTDVGDFTMKRGPLRSSIEFVKSTGGGTITIPDIRKNDCEEMYNLIELYITRVRERLKIQSDGAPPALSEDPLAILKARFARGEISKEEFEEMKSALT